MNSVKQLMYVVAAGIFAVSLTSCGSSDETTKPVMRLASSEIAALLGMNQADGGAIEMAAELKELKPGSRTLIITGSDAKVIRLIPDKDGSIDVNLLDEEYKTTEKLTYPKGYTLLIPETPPNDIVNVRVEMREGVTTLPRVQFDKPEVRISNNMIIAKESTKPPLLQITPRDLVQSVPKEGEKVSHVREGVITRLPGQLIITFFDPQNIMADGIRRYNDIGGIAPGRLVLEDGSAGLNLPNPNINNEFPNHISTGENAVIDLIRRFNLAGKNVLSQLKGTDSVKKGMYGLKTTETAPEDVTFKEFTEQDIVRTGVTPAVEQEKTAKKGRTTKTKTKGRGMP